MKKFFFGMAITLVAIVCIGATIDVWLLQEVTTPDADTDVMPIVKTGGSSGAGRKITFRHLAEWVLAVTHPNSKFVDAATGDDSSGKPYATLAGAIAGASSGNSVEILSDLNVSSYVTIGTASVTINGNGRKLTAGSEGQVNILRATAANIKIDRLELACGRVSSNTIVNNGHIEVAAAGFEIRNSYIHDGVGIGVRVMQGADWAKVSYCRFSTLGSGIIAQGSSGAGPSHIVFDHNRVENMIDSTNSKGIYVGTPDGTIVSSDINVEGNTVVNCGGSDIEIWRNHKQIRVVGNHTEGAIFAISVDAGHNFAIVGNQVTGPAGANSYGIEIPNGCDHGTVSGNDIDGRVSGTPQMFTGVSISNNVQSVDLVVSGNTIRGFTAAGIGGSNFSGLVATGNNITQESSGAQAFILKDAIHSSISNNVIRITAGDAPIILDSTDLAVTDVSISGNRFIGAPSGKLISLYANVNAISNVTIENNRAWDCTFLASGFINYVTASGGTITGVFRSGNLPDRTTLANNQAGFDNDQFGWLGPDVHVSIGTSASSVNPSFDLYNGATAKGNFALAEGSSAFATGAAVNDVIVRAITGGIFLDTIADKPIILSINDVEKFRIDTDGSPKFSGANTTGAGSAALGANSPATTNTAPYTWIKVKTADGSTAYIPAWK